MLRPSFALPLAALLTACAPHGETQSPEATSEFTEADHDAVLAVLEAQKTAWNAGDLEGYMAGYERSEALVFTSGGNIRRGWQETHDKYQARYGGDSSGMGHLEFEIDELRALGTDAAVVLGHWYLTETPQSGSGVFSVILLRTADGWKVVHDHTSASAEN
jgi:ketosteroid isomerase-like protein